MDPRLLFSFLLLFVAHVASKDFYLNTTLLSDCYNDCFLTDPEIWGGANATIPSTKDTIFINLPTDAPPARLRVVNASVAYNIININGQVTIILASGSVLQVNSLSLKQASVIVASASVLRPNRTVYMDQAQITLEQYSSYEHRSGMLVLTNTSRITSTTNTTVIMPTANISGELVLPQDAFGFWGTTVNFMKEQNISAASFFERVNIYRCAVTFGSGLTAGSLFATGSAITVVGSSIVTSLAVQMGTFDSFGPLAAINITSSGPRFSVYGNLQATSMMSSSLSVYGVATVGILQIVGGVNTVQGLVADNVTLTGNANLTVETSAFVQVKINTTQGNSTVIFSNAQVLLNATFVSGKIVVNNSQITMYYPYAPATSNPRFIFMGDLNTLSAPSLNIYDHSFTDPSAFVEVSISSQVNLEKPLTFQGSVIMTGGVFNAAADATFLGSVVLKTSKASIKGAFTALRGLSVNSSTCTFGEGTTFNGTTLLVGTNATLTSLFKTTVVASMTVNGNLITSAPNPLAIYGRLVQRGTLTINNIRRGLPAMITVVGPAAITGIFSYQSLVVASGESVKMPVLATTQGITGKFTETSRVFEYFDYDQKNLYLRFSENGAASVCVSWAVVVVLLCSL